MDRASVWKFSIRGWSPVSKQLPNFNLMDEKHGVVMHTRSTMEGGITAGTIEFTKAVDRRYVNFIMSNLYPNRTYDTSCWFHDDSEDDFTLIDHIDWKCDRPTCCLCSAVLNGVGHNANPSGTGRCCGKCNQDVVIPSRCKVP